MPTIDLGVGKEFYFKEIVACCGGGFEIKNYFDNVWPPLVGNEYGTNEIVAWGMMGFEKKIIVIRGHTGVSKEYCKNEIFALGGNGL